MNQIKNIKCKKIMKNEGIILPWRQYRQTSSEKRIAISPRILDANISGIMRRFYLIFLEFLKLFLTLLYINIKIIL